MVNNVCILITVIFQKDHPSGQCHLVKRKVLCVTENVIQGAFFLGNFRKNTWQIKKNRTSRLESIKVKKDEKRLSDLQEKIAGEQVTYADNHKAFMTFGEIDSSGKKTIMGKYTVSAEDYEKLTTLAKQSYSAVAEANELKEENRRLSSRIWSLESEVSRLRTTLAELKEKCKPYLDALKAAPKAVKEFIDSILEKSKKQEKDIMYDPIPTDKPLPLKKPKSKDYER